MCKFTVIAIVYRQVGFSAADSVTGLKLIEAGVPKENLALLAIPMIPIQILLPLYISKYTAGMHNNMISIALEFMSFYHFTYLLLNMYFHFVYIGTDILICAGRL